MNAKLQEIINEAGCEWINGRLFDKRSKEICNFLPEVVGCYRTLSKENITYKMWIHTEGQRVETLLNNFNYNKIDYSIISPRCIYGINVPIYESKRILNYIVQKQIAQFLDEGILLTRLGWNKLPDGQWVYCAGKELIRCNGDYKLIVDEELQRQFKIEMRKSEYDVLSVCARMLNMQCPTVTVLVLVSVVACLRSLFVEAGVVPHFVTYIYGTTGTYKTTVAKYFSRLYGNQIDLGGLFGELESTNYALEEKISQVKDTCVVIDDIAPCQKDKNTKEKKERAASLIRKATSEIGTRKGEGGQVVDKRYDVLLIFTAEELLGTISTVNRTVLLSTDKYHITSKMLKLMRKNPDFSILLQRKIITWATENSELITKKIKKNFRKYRNIIHLDSNAKSINRIHESFCILHVAWDLLRCCDEHYGNENFLSLGESVGEDVEKVLFDEIQIVKKMEHQMQPRNPLKKLCDIVEGNELRIASSRTDYELLCAMGQENEVCGVWHKNALYLKDDCMLEYMKSKHGLMISKHDFRKLLEQEGILIKDKSNSKRKKLCGRSFVVIDFAELKTLCEW